MRQSIVSPSLGHIKSNMYKLLWPDIEPDKTFTRCGNIRRTVRRVCHTIPSCEQFLGPSSGSSSADGPPDCSTVWTLHIPRSTTFHLKNGEFLSRRTEYTTSTIMLLRCNDNYLNKFQTSSLRVTAVLCSFYASPMYSLDIAIPAQDQLRRVLTERGHRS